MDSEKNYIKSIIAKEVFVKGSEQLIISPEGTLSDWIFDFRRSILKPEMLDACASLFLEQHSSKYPYQVGGLEVGAIPLVAAIVMKSLQNKTPVNGFFIRKSRKKKGLLNAVEGTINDTPIILVDDIMNSGSSFVQQMTILDELRKGGNIVARVAEVYSIVRFKDAKQYSHIAQQGIAVTSSFSLNDFRDELSISNLAERAGEATKVNPYKVLWLFRGKSPHLWKVRPKSAPILYKNMVFFGTDAGHFMCLDVGTGKEIWSYFVAFGKRDVEIFSSPIICGENVLWGCHDGNIYALNIFSGKRSWIYTEADWVHGTFAYADDIGSVFAPLSFGLLKKHGKVVALDVASGKKKWEFAVNAPITSSIGYSKKHGMIFFGTNDGMIYGLNVKNGECLWKNIFQIEMSGAPCVDNTGDMVVFGGVSMSIESGNASYVYTCEIATGKIHSVFRQLNFGTCSTPIVQKQHAYISSLDKFLYCFDINTGDLVWKINLEARSFASPMFVPTKNGLHLFVGANNGRLHEIEPKEGRVVSITYLPERIVDAVVYDQKNDVLLVPTFANELYALKKSN